MNTFNILWLDDEPISELSLIENEHPNFKIHHVQHIDVCEHLIEDHSEEFHAIILDANGISSYEVEKEPNKNGFISLVLLAKEKGLPVYIYSGQINRGVGDSDITLEFLRNEGPLENINLFYKSGGSDPLIEQIEKDLEKDYKVFYQYPLLLDNVLHYNVNKEVVKELLLWMNDKENNTFPVMSKLRSIIFDNDIFGQVKQLLGIEENGSIDFRKRNLEKICMTEWETNVINFLLQHVLSANTHNLPSDNRYLQDIVAKSTIVTLEWFNRFMHKFASTKDSIAEEHDITTDTNSNHSQPEQQLKIEDKTPEGILERDQDGFLHLGNCLIPPNKVKYSEGQKVRITKQYFSKYKRIAKWIDIIK